MLVQREDDEVELMTPSVPSRLIQCFSKVWSGAEPRYHPAERTARALLLCLQDARWLTLSSSLPVQVYTVNEDLSRALDETGGTVRISKWKPQLSELHYQHNVCKGMPL